MIILINFITSTRHAELITRTADIQLIVCMMTSSNANIFRVTGPLCGEFPGHRSPTQRLVTRSFDDFYNLRLNKRLSKQPWGWWFEMLSCSLWRHCNGYWPFPKPMTRDDIITWKHFPHYWHIRWSFPRKWRVSPWCFRWSPNSGVAGNLRCHGAVVTSLWWNKPQLIADDLHRLLCEV